MKQILLYCFVFFRRLRRRPGNNGYPAPSAVFFGSPLLQPDSVVLPGRPAKRSGRVVDAV